MAKKKMPTLQYCVLADDIATFQDSNKIIIVGIFEQILVDNLPSSHAKMWILTRWTNGVGDFISQTKIISSDKRVIFESETVSFSLKSVEASYNINGQIFGLPLENIGTYWVETYIDNELVSQTPLVVMKKSEEPLNQSTVIH